MDSSMPVGGAPTAFDPNGDTAIRISLAERFADLSRGAQLGITIGMLAFMAVGVTEIVATSDGGHLF